MSHSYPRDISREQFARILPVLESARRRTKPRTVDLYDVFSGVLYLLKSGCQWRMLPADFPNWRTCYQYFRQWSERSGPGQDSILEQVLKNRLARPDKAMDGKSRPASASWTPRASRTRTVPIARAMTRARRCRESSVTSRWTRQDCPMGYTRLPPTLPTGPGLWRCLTKTGPTSTGSRRCWSTGVTPGSPLPLRCKACWEPRWKW